MAATPERSMEKVSLAPERARESSFPPSSRSGPTFRSCTNSSPVGDECNPILRIGFDWVRPGIPFSSTKLRTLASRASCSTGYSLM
jgi:hypothetical protein